MRINKLLSTPSHQIETWLGNEVAEEISNAMRGYHADIAIPVANIPDSRVYVTRDGDFVGSMKGGHYNSLWNLMQDRAARSVRKTLLNTGFASLSDLISELTTGGKRQDFMMNKVSGTAIALVAQDLWNKGNVPSAGGVATAAAAGHSPTNATTGAIKFTTPGGSDTLHFLGGVITSDVAARTLLMYDRFYAVNHTMTVDPQAVSGTPTRYQDTTAAGNFITVFVTTVFPAATPTYTITYVDDAGNTAEAAAAQTIVSASAVSRFPFAATVGAGWYIPLNSGDQGVRSITDLNLSAAMASGAADVVLGKPVAFLPTSVGAGIPIVVDGVNSPLFMHPVNGSACLAFFDIMRSSTATTTYQAYLSFCSG